MKISDPVGKSVAIDYSAADQVLSPPCTAIYITTAGDLKIDEYPSGNATTWTLAVGWHPIRASKIYKTGSTTAAGRVAWAMSG